MSEDRFKISLRTKRKPRPAISAPQQITKPAPLNGAPTPQRSNGGKASLTVPSSGGKTSDLVKRRYSTRFNNQAGYDASLPPPIPSIPEIPGQPRGQGINFDLLALKNPGLNAEKYVASMLADASEQEIEDFQQQLKRLRNRTSTDLQQNVYQNRTQFIKISKEAEKLKGEMRALRNLMAELKSNTSALRSASGENDYAGDDGNYPTTLSKRDKRSSVAQLSQLWNSHLQAMWKQIAGSQKFLPAAVGRHVIQNAGQWMELDPATWKSRRPMQLVLLNDHLLVASRKKGPVEEGGNRNGPQAAERLVADRCWPLLDIDMVDLARSNNGGSARVNVDDAIMVRGVGHESFTYRTEKSGTNAKASLLLSFRKAVEELKKGKRQEIESSNKTKDTNTYFAIRDPGLLKKAELLESLSEIKDRPNMLIEVDGKQQNMRWVEGQIDELDIDIALQKFESAVARVEKLKSLAKGLKNNALAQDFVNFKADERALKLGDLVTHELIENHNYGSKTKCNVDWLSRLGFDNRAREAYLKARSQLINKRTRQCIFGGNLQNYIWEVSFVYFTIIKNTVVTFKECFPSLVMSACVKWAKEQVDAFNVILLRQLSNTDRGEKRYLETLNQAKYHARQLADVGLDFESLIGRDPKAEEAQQAAAISANIAELGEIAAAKQAQKQAERQAQAQQ